MTDIYVLWELRLPSVISSAQASIILSISNYARPQTVDLYLLDDLILDFVTAI